MIPLRDMLPDDRLERTQDFLRKLDAGLAVADGRAVVMNFGKNMREVAAGFSNDEGRNDGAARRPRQLRGRDGGKK